MKYLLLSLFGIIVAIVLLFFYSQNQVVAPLSRDVSIQTTATIPTSSEFQIDLTPTSTITTTTTTTEELPKKEVMFTSVPEVNFLNSLLFQGDTLVADVKNSSIPTNVNFDSRDLPVFKYGDFYKVVGAIQATETIGYHNLSMKFADGTSYSKKLYIREQKFPLVDLGIPEELGVTAGQLVQNLAAEKVNINSIITLKANEVFFAKTFGLPLADNRRIISPYGELRKTGDQLIRHLGIDFGAAKGSSVVSINDGVVREAKFDQTYGNTIIIDHGAGIFSLYMHLDTMKVKIGQSVKKGQLIGTVGQTGYATGPHLHLSVKIGNVSIDPIKFVNIFR